jgi:glyoxylase-like metal-dependent hydrolase (beta-lactamase superfamily II)
MVIEKGFEFLDENVVALYDMLFPLYIVRGENTFLIDSGAAVKAEGFYVRIQKVLTEIFRLGNPTINTLILTHSHWDHVGGSKYLQQKFRYDVLCSKRTAELLQNPKVVDMIDRMNQEFKKLISQKSNLHFKKLKNLRIVKEGDIIPINSDHQFEVIETPGHTKCSLAFLLQPEKILFPGDATGLMDPDGTIRPLFFSNYINYENSLKRLIKLEAEVLALPHNKFIKGRDRVDQYLNNSLEVTRTAGQEIADYLSKGLNSTEIAEILYTQKFAKASFMGPREAVLQNLKSMVNSVSIKQNV